MNISAVILGAVFFAAVFSSAQYVGFLEGQRDVKMRMRVDRSDVNRPYLGVYSGVCAAFDQREYCAVDTETLK